jgi:cell division protein FtsZ
MKPMALNLSSPRSTELKPRIVVFGVGGAGGNAVNNMIEAGLEGVEFVVANTDAQQLQRSHTERRIQLGVSITEGLGAGAHPEIGQSAAEESIPEISEHLEGAHMVFITAGMGGGTGTGAAPIIAKAARERNILTVGVVTKPFHFEGRHRMRLAEAGVTELQRHVDTLIVIPNQNLFRVANERTTFAEAFGMADEVLHSGVRSITDLMVLPGLINLDFADVRTVMTEMGKAMMGTGEAGGEDRALMAAQNAIQNPLLDEVSLKGAKAVLVNVTGGLDMTLLEVDEAANAISSEVDPEANIIFGAAFDPSLEGKIRVSVVATGMDGAAKAAIEPASRTLAQPVAAPAARTGSVQPVAPAPALPLEPAVAAYAPAPEPAVVVEPGRAASSAQPLRIVDPAAAEEEDDYYPSIAPPAAGRPRPDYRSNPAPAVEQRRSPPKNPLPDPRVPPEKKGWLSLFGGGRAREELTHPRNLMESPRYEDPAPRMAPSSAPAAGGQAAALKPQVEPEPADDLDIPSFLRRLAN